MNKEQIINAINLTQKYIDNQFETHGQFAITDWVITTDKNYEISRIEKEENETIDILIDFIFYNGITTYTQGRWFHVSEDGTVR